jgi:hypothetical protein
LTSRLGLLSASYSSAHLTVRANGQVLSHATAFLCSAGLNLFLVTARHVVTGRHNESGDLLSATGAVPDELGVRYIMPTVQGPKFEERIEPLYNPTGHPRWVEHPTHGARADCVAVPIGTTRRFPMLPYNGEHPLGTRDPKIVYGPSDPVSVVGYPFGKDAGGYAIWATGFVASEPSVDYAGLPILLVDCRTRPGQSGAPVILQRNSGLVLLEDGSMISDGRPRSRFLGVYSGRVNPESDIGMVWKTSAIREILTAVARAA